jgi:hypothetical protein
MRKNAESSSSLSHSVSVSLFKSFDFITGEKTFDYLIGNSSQLGVSPNLNLAVKSSGEDAGQTQLRHKTHSSKVEKNSISAPAYPVAFFYARKYKTECPEQTTLT